MNIKYYRDGGRNYMVIKTTATKQNDFQNRMVNANRMKHLLRSHTRVLDAEQYLYYETGGMISLENRFTSKKMDGTEIRRLFTDLQSAVREMEGFLLDPDGLILQPDCIFSDLNGEQYRFCFSAGHDKSGETTTLMSWLMAHAAREDESFSLLQEGQALARMGNGSLYEILDKILPEDVEIEPMQHNVSTAATTMDAGLESVWEWSETLEDEVDFTPQMAQYGTKDDEEPEAKKGIAFKVMTALFVLTFAANVYLRIHYELTLQEQVLSGTVAVISLLMAVAAFFSARTGKKLSVFKKGKEKALPPQEEIWDEEDEPEPGDLESLSLEDDLFFEKKDRHESHRPHPFAQAATEPAEALNEENDTVLLAQEQWPSRHKLYSLGEERLIKIDLSKLPVTVGKLPGVADFLLKKDGVSRLHVRFFQKEEGERVYMKDLNSTNGTFRNGTRVSAGEEVALLPGDEIRIGRTEFEFV